MSQISNAKSTPASWSLYQNQILNMSHISNAKGTQKRIGKSTEGLLPGETTAGSSTGKWNVIEIIL